ncbi:MAG: BamA/TamA family outer membrane protein [Atribacterota bacterium]|nr:BamA/TamA family outer membrane protein [Atribacterota bacterium]MDD4895491.1 BamA/TamA family outer membrane protein [Atribacterota bacterium]MDD5637856.1 BamA/TamA family outer membrane protein [Atribacterota bacterium]
MRNKIVNKCFLFVIIVLILLFPFFNTALAQNNGKITAIVVRDNEHIDTKFIVSLISSNIGDLFSKDKVQADMKAIFDLGYFQDVQVKLEPFRDGYRVVFQVKENAIIEDIVIEGSTILADQEIKDVMVLSKGQVFSQKILQNDLDRISQLYKERGLILAQVEEIDFNQNTGVLLIKLAEGIIEEVRISGNEKTVDKVIRREINIESGELFDFSKVKESLQEVYNLGFFEDVSMRLEPGSEEHLIVVVIEVKEKSTGLFGGGGGYSTGEGLFAYASIKESNLFGRGQSIEAKLEVGTRTTYSFSFYEPWLGNTPTFFGLDVYDSFMEVNKKIDGIDSKYEMERIGGKLTFGREFKEHFKVGLELKTEDASYNLISGQLPDNIQEGLTNSFRPILIYDTRDDRFNPTEGWYGTASIQNAGGILGGDYDYRKYDLDLRTYLSTDIFEEDRADDTTITSTINQGVLAMRMVVGVGDTSLPSFAKYEVGGLGTIRGYEYKEFSGDTSLIFNIEYRFPLADNLQAVIFADWGNAWDFGESIAIGDLKFGKGVGIRFDTFLGPISIDYGFGEDEEGKAYFSIGHTF